MKKKNKFKVFFVIILISVIITFNFTISFNTRGQISLQENVEAVAWNWEEEWAEAEKICTTAGGLCIIAGTTFLGISYPAPPKPAK